MAQETREMKIRLIPSTEPVMDTKEIKDQKLRMAAYCRVSTDSEEQINSYNSQKAYYTQLIESNPNWIMAGLFADEGISGVSMKNRTEFNRMIAACKRGRIDMILTKSLSRFARNTVDCLETVRKLKALGIGVIFEKENINTLTESSEFMITLFSSFAQAESESLSKNVTWGIRKNMEAGKFPIQYDKLLGYRKGADGQPEIVPEEAETVKQIFRWYINGYSLGKIQKELEARQLPNAAGNTTWSRTTVQNILLNEKYVGDVLYQKTYTLDCISKIRRKNNGEVPMFYVENHHTPIIARSVFLWVQEEMKRRTSRRKVMQKTAVTEQGKYSGKYALTERLVCGECGSPYKRCTWTARGQKRIVWRCVSRLEYGKKYCHNSPTMDEEKLHQAILDALNQRIHLANAGMSAKELAKTAALGSLGDGMSLAEMQHKAAEITAEQERLLDMILDDMENPELNDRMQKLTEEKKRLLDGMEAKRAELAHHEAEILRMQELDEWCAEHPAGLRAYDDVATRRLIDQIKVMDKLTIQIQFSEQSEPVAVALHETGGMCAPIHNILH